MANKFTDFEFALIRARCLNACGFKAQIQFKAGVFVVSVA